MGSVWDARRPVESARSLRESPGRRHRRGESTVRGATQVMPRSVSAAPIRDDQEGSGSMMRFPGRRPKLALAALMPLLLLALPLWANAETKSARTHKVHLVSHQPAPSTPQASMNAWTVGLAGGLLEGAPIRLAAEIARVVDDGDNLHVLPVVTRGAAENVNSLLYLRGIDAAIINSDSLDEYKNQVPDIQRKIAYVLNLFPSELHVFVRPEIQSLADLAGKKVNFNSLGTAAAY